MMTDIPSMPSPVPFDPTNTQIVGLLILVTVLVAYAFITRVGRLDEKIRQQLFCPVRRRMAKVTFWLSPTGQRTDVARCSIFGRRPITCGKVCMAGPPRA